MNLLILASGNGSLAQALIDAKFNILAIVSDNSEAKVLQRAKIADLPAKVIPFAKPRATWDAKLFDYVDFMKPDLVVSVGFMRILSSEFVTHFKVINSHPSLLPNFPGSHAVQDALAAKVPTTGCTVHWVDQGVDSGPIISQIEVPIQADDDVSSLHERIKTIERELVVKVIKELGAKL
jgi:phosphoribosylglycinamide formyltransferase-1